VAKAGCACVIAVNKWDKVSEKEADDMEAYQKDVKAQLRAVGWSAVVCTTARWVDGWAAWMNIRHEGPNAQAVHTPHASFSIGYLTTFIQSIN
jgi:predicted GTPase